MITDKEREKAKADSFNFQFIQDESILMLDKLHEVHNQNDLTKLEIHHCHL